MGKMRLLFVAVVLLLGFRQSASAQENIPVQSGTKKPVLTVLLPLYLDSAFDASGQYRYGKQFPRFMLPGLEFYEGVQFAIDSLKKENVSLELNIVDTRSVKTIYDVLKLPAVTDASLLLSYVSNNEIRPLAEYANRKQVPFINVNLPNDGGVTNNPYMVILNSTLATHCEGMYRFLQLKNRTSTIIVFRKTGPQEDRLKNYFTEIEKSTSGAQLKLKYINLPSNFTAANLTPYLDSTETTMCVAGSLDESFGRNICLQLAELNKTYPVQILGMPTWDNIRDFEKPEFKDLEIFYSTPFNPQRNDPVSEQVNTHFKDNLYARPSDMVFRGFETTYRFSKLLVELGPNIATGLGIKKYRIFTDFDIQPVLLDKKTQQLDYFENKKLYIVKKVNGAVVTVF